MTKLYTKKGDRGQTGLNNGHRVPKNHIRVEAYGTVDEVNALLGLISTQLSDPSQRTQLEHVQGMLFEIGTVLARPDARHHRPDDGDVLELEFAIDEMTNDLPPLTNFILPGGTELAATIHLARTITRRAERRVITVSQHEEVPPVILRYLNRLSDFLFILARFINHQNRLHEKPWHSEEM